MAKVLITGGAGYIGDCVAEYLVNSGHDVTIFDNLMYGGMYMRRGVKFIRGDVTDYTFLRVCMERGKYTSVIHLAGIVGDGACQVNPTYTVNVNEIATNRIARLCTKLGVRMVFASTCSVYGANNDLLDEESDTNPLSIYAGTKLNAEAAVKKVPSHAIFRLGTLFGMSTEHARIRCDLVANILTYRVMQGKSLTVFGGEQWRPLLHVRDAGKIFAQAAVQPEFNGMWVLSRSNMRIIDLAERIIMCAGIGDIVKTDMKFEDLRDYRVDNSKAKQDGFVADISIHVGISEMIQVMHEGRIADVWDTRFHNAQYAGEVIRD